MKKIIILFLTIASLSNVACAQKTIKGNGILGTETRKTSTYDKITLIGSTDVELIDGVEGNLVISSETNLLSYIETEVVDNELIIKFKEKHSFTIKKPLKVIVPVKDVSVIKIKGSGDIVGKNKFLLKNLNVVVNGSGDLSLEVESDLVSAEVFGSGDIKLKGSVKKFNATVKGSGDISAKNLISEISDLSVNGSGDIESNTTSQVNASVFGSGDISIFGNPTKVTKQVKGSGDILVK